MSNDFLTQIETTEKEAGTMVQKAREKGQQEIQNEKIKLTKERESHLEQARINAKKTLAEKQQGIRKMYENDRKEGERATSALENECKPKIGKVLPSALQYLLTDLI